MDDIHPKRLTAGPILPLALPVIAGLVWMGLSQAPANYLAVNGLALVLACLIALFMRVSREPGRMVIIAVGLVPMLWLTALLGHPVDGIRRWFSLGPLTMHTGNLVVPLLCVLLARVQDWVACILLLAAIAASVAQPDLAIALGLAASATCSAILRRNLPALIAFVAGGLALARAWAGNVDIPPVRFVEQVTADGFAKSIISGLLLLIAQFAFLALLRRNRDADDLALACFLSGTAIAGLVAAFPSVLIGYGASPILGFGLALAALRERSVRH